MGQNVGHVEPKINHQLLTDRSIKNKKTGTYEDGSGLRLRVTKTGAKTWVLRIVVRRRRRDMGLGGYPTVGLKEARTLAQYYRKIARDGGDPFVDRGKTKRIVPTFKEAALACFEENKPTWKNDKHTAQWINTLQNYVFPVLGSLPVDSIQSGEIKKTIDPIWLTRQETARRILQRIKTVLLWAKGNSYRTDSPGEEIESVRKSLPKQKEKVKHFASLPHKHVKQFILSMKQSNAEAVSKLAFEYLLLTAVRTKEVLDATWDEIDEKEQVWTIPEKRMKAGKEHRVPLSSQAVRVLEQMKVNGKNDGNYVFANDSKKRHLSNMVFAMILRRMDVKATAHGFRSSFRDWCSECTNAPREVAEAALAHAVRDQVEAAYRRTDLFDKRRELMQQWADYIT